MKAIMSAPKSAKRVLVVTYNFPPVGGAGVQRVTKFVKYLPQFGWEPTVLTAENPSVPVLDDSLLADIPPQTAVIKARTLEPGYALKRIVSASNTESWNVTRSVSEGAKETQDVTPSLTLRVTLASVAKRALRGATNLLLQPDPQVLWNPQAIEVGLRVLSQQKHDAIFVTAPPFSSFLIGAELARRTGLPLVLDYRDEWSISNSYLENKRLGWLSRTWQQHQQSLCVRAASALVATTKHSAESLAAVARASESRPLVTHIYNGFDAADFHERIPPLADPLLDSAGGAARPYKLAYVGTLWNLTSVEPIVRAVRQLAERSPDLASRLELHFVGRRTAAQDEWLDRLGALPCRVVRKAYLDHDAAVRLMRSADGLCLLLSDLPEAGRVVPAKMFEYLAVRRPIFAVVPPGEVSSLLQDCRFAFVHSPSDVTGLAQRLGDEIERHRLGVPLPTGIWDASAFERRRQAEQLADLLNVINPTNGSIFRRPASAFSTSSLGQAEQAENGRRKMKDICPGLSPATD
jgi:glycosyltransferase involved in cell wall biosynthesis